MHRTDPTLIHRRCTSMKPLPRMFRAVLTILSILCFASITINAVVAEQIVIDENCEDKKVAGDFVCSPCYSPILSESETVDFSAKAMTTGELYQYFESRGIKKLNRLSFQVDVDCDPDNSESVSVTDLSFQIQDASSNLVTNAVFGDSELLLDKSEITSFKPEAVLEIDLGYDFMERFTSESKEAVMLNFNSSGSSSDMMPRIVLSSDMSSFSTGNLARISGFVAFWGLIFFGAHVVTRKRAEDKASDDISLTAAAATVVGRQAVR